MIKIFYSLFYSISSKGHRWNCSQVWKNDVFGHVVIVGEYLIILLFIINQGDLERVFN